MFVPVELHNFFLQVRIPNKHLEIKATTHDDFVLLAIRHFSHCLFVAFKDFDRLLGEVFSQFFRQLLFEISFQHDCFFRFGLDFIFVILRLLDCASA